jgi:hypothetical protein
MYQIENILHLQTCKLIATSASKTTSGLSYEIIYPNGSLQVVSKSVKDKTVWLDSLFLAICNCTGIDERVIGWKHQYMLGISVYLLSIYYLSI